MLTFGMKTLVGLWLEWDCGQENLVFNSEEHAFAWFVQAIDENELEYMYFSSHQDIFDQGMAGYQIITIWEPQE
jgi:hypothetical protein